MTSSLKPSSSVSSPLPSGVATPLIFGAIGELVAESAGILNLSVEGTMTIGALVGFAVAGCDRLAVARASSGRCSPGGAMGLLMAFMSATVKVDQIVAGLALNLFGAGLSFFLFRTIFADTASTEIPTVGVFTVPKFPVLSDIPWIGEVFFSQQWLTYIAFLSVPLVWIFLNKTRYGLELRSVGHNPECVRHARDQRAAQAIRCDHIRWDDGWPGRRVPHAFHDRLVVPRARFQAVAGSPWPSSFLATGVRPGFCSGRSSSASSMRCSCHCRRLDSNCPTSCCWPCRSC